jgi:hypothetical protein
LSRVTMNWRQYWIIRTAFNFAPFNKTRFFPTWCTTVPQPPFLHIHIYIYIYVSNFCTFTLDVYSWY